MPANLLHRPVDPLHERIRCGANYKFPIPFLSRPRKVTGPRKVVKGLTTFADEQCFTPKFTSAFSFGVGIETRKDIYHLSSPQRVPRQGSAQISQSFSEPVVLQIRNIYTCITRALIAEISKAFWRGIVSTPAEDP